MSIVLSIVFLSLALAADAFAVSLCQGAVASRKPWREALMIGGAFGLAQALAPLVGWSLGMLFASTIERVDHWIAFGLLSVVGAKMIWEGLSHDPPGEEPERGERSATGWALFALAVAVSIDAAAAGFTLPALGAPILVSVAAIGGITFIASAAGVFIGRLSGDSLGSRAEAAGGVILIAIGIRVLFDHHAFG
jgi:putative Mn2+ efflux pump MntP